MAQAEEGDPQALRILLDRLDGPIGAALAANTINLQNIVAPVSPPSQVQVVLVDNHRDSRPVEMPLPQPQLPAPAKQTVAVKTPQEEVESDGWQDDGVVSGEEFLKE